MGIGLGLALSDYPGGYCGYCSSPGTVGTTDGYCRVLWALRVLWVLQGTVGTAALQGTVGTAVPSTLQYPVPCSTHYCRVLWTVVTVDTVGTVTVGYCGYCRWVLQGTA